MTSVRLDSSDGISSAHGDPLVLDVLDAEPVGDGLVDLDVDAAGLVGRGVEHRVRRDVGFAERDAVLDRPGERVVAAVLELGPVLVVELLLLGRASGCASGPARQASNPKCRTQAFRSSRIGSFPLSLVGDLSRARDTSRRSPCSGSTPSPGSSGTRMQPSSSLIGLRASARLISEGSTQYSSTSAFGHRGQEMQRGRGVDVGGEVVVGDRDAALVRVLGDLAATG